MTDVLVLAAGQGDVPSQGTLELLGAARRLADSTGGQVRAAVLEATRSGLGARLFAFGADQVYRVEHALLNGSPADACVEALVQVASVL